MTRAWAVAAPGVAPARTAVRRPRGRSARGGWLLAAARLLLLCAPLVGMGGSAGEKMAKGTYCPIPQPGQAPRCLGAAQAEYEDFFEALGRGALDDASSARVEADLLSAERAHLALSSLAYGYYQLARTAAEAPDAHPDFVARLAHWNDLLAATYETSVPLRGVLREAAADIEARAPAVEGGCGADVAGCDPAASLSETFAAIDATAGVRGPLVRLWERWASVLGGDTPEEQP